MDKSKQKWIQNFAKGVVGAVTSTAEVAELQPPAPSLPPVPLHRGGQIIAVRENQSRASSQEHFCVPKAVKIPILPFPAFPPSLINPCHCPSCHKWGELQIHFCVPAMLHRARLSSGFSEQISQVRGSAPRLEGNTHRDKEVMENLPASAAVPGWAWPSHTAQLEQAWVASKPPLAHRLGETAAAVIRGGGKEKVGGMPLSTEVKRWGRWRGGILPAWKTLNNPWLMLLPSGQKAGCSCSPLWLIDS